MTIDTKPTPDSWHGGQPVDARRLWTGGLATAAVAALTAVVGILIARSVFSVSVLAPEGHGVWGDATTFDYALGAAVTALLATGLIHLLVLYAPGPALFFGWIMVLAIVAGVVAPFANHPAGSAEWATAAINLAIGVAVWALVAAAASSAVHADAAARGPLSGSPSPSGNLK
jgi:uncharacterized protein DUF6069